MGKPVTDWRWGETSLSSGLWSLLSALVAARDGEGIGLRDGNVQPCLQSRAAFGDTMEAVLGTVFKSSLRAMKHEQWHLLTCKEEEP